MIEACAARVHPVAAKGAATREHILRIAFQLIGEVGWAQITTRLIAERAGINNAMVNYHFRSKESLLQQAARTYRSPSRLARCWLWSDRTALARRRWVQPLARLLEPSTGTALVAGLDVRTAATSLGERIGYMSDGFTLYGSHSVAENLAFFGELYSVSGAERARRIAELLRFSYLDGAFSSGSWYTA